MKTMALAAVLGLGLVVGCGDGENGGAGNPSTNGTGGAAGATGAAGAGGECPVDSSYMPTIKPADFVDSVDNPLFPLIPGTKFIYSEGDNTDTVTVLSKNKTILGVSCTTVRDTLTDPDGAILEDTNDWYAQDTDGAVWYFGEDTAEYENGKVVSTEGSWTGGVDGALPGILVPADPKVGDSYRQEYYACEAEDMGEILDLDSPAKVTYGSYTGCLKTRDTTPIEPSALEEKYYCPDVGLVLSVDKVTGDREELTDIVMP